MSTRGDAPGAGVALPVLIAPGARRRALIGAALVLLLAGPAAAQRAEMPAPFRLGASADWEYYRSDSTSQGTSALFTSFRQKYSLDLLGTIWDPRFSRFQIGLDLYQTDRERDGVQLDSDTWGYRAALTFFPNRPFPLRLFARSSVTDVAGIALADSDRENAAWGAEWNLALGDTQHLRLSYERSGFDLVSPVALEERRRIGLAEYRKQWKRTELTARYGYHDQKEMVNGSRFTRDDFALTQRTRFDGGVTWLTNLYHTLSDATFSGGTMDELTIDRFSTVVDLPRTKKVGWTFGYDYNNNDGRFVDSTSHNLRGNSRILIGERWEALAGAVAGKIDTATNAGDTGQDLYGVNAGIRFHRDWERLQLSWTASLGYNQTDFTSGPSRDLINRDTEIDLRVPLSRGGQFFSTLARREDETDVTGVGYSRDETYASAGVEGRLTETFRGRTMGYVRDVKRDTFDFGLQESRTYGLESTLTGRDLSLTLNLATTDGISDFIPDPALGSPFTPGADLVSASDSAILGLRWRLGRRLRLRAEGRYEKRDFTSIGREQILSFHPQLDWIFRVWTFSFGYSHYERDNTTAFSDDTLLIRISRKFL